MGSDRRALTSAFSYLIMGSVGATFIVIGIGLLYAMTGTLNIADLAARVPAVSGSRTIPVAFAFLTVGVSLKLALFPLHLWLPNAYTYAPSTVSAVVASTATKVAVYMLLRFFFTIFGVAFAFEVMNLDAVLVPLALVAAVATSVVAIFQSNVKRLLAYSSLAQIGYIVLGISFGTATGLTAGILHLFNHALMKGALFMALGCVFYRLGTVEIESMDGLGRRDALDDGRLRGGRAQPDRRSAHRGLHQQVVPDPGGAGEGLVAGRGDRPLHLAAGGRVHLARGGGGLLPAGARGLAGRGAR